jgi:hypothetical protein
VIAAVVILCVIVGILSAALVYAMKLQAGEIKFLVRAVVAKDGKELAFMEKYSQPKPTPKKTSELSPDEFQARLRESMDALDAKPTPQPVGFDG